MLRLVEDLREVLMVAFRNCIPLILAHKLVRMGLISKWKDHLY